MINMPTFRESVDYIDKCIKSCKTEDHLYNCGNMVTNLVNRSENKNSEDIIRVYFETNISKKLRRM